MLNNELNPSALARKLAKQKVSQNAILGMVGTYHESRSLTSEFLRLQKLCRGRFTVVLSDIDVVPFQIHDLEQHLNIFKDFGALCYSTGVALQVPGHGVVMATCFIIRSEAVFSINRYKSPSSHCFHRADHFQIIAYSVLRLRVQVPNNQT